MTAPVRHDHPDGGGATVYFQNDRDRAGYLKALADGEHRAWRRDHWYACGGSVEVGCGRWFGIDYRDPVTGETLQDHDCNGTQLELFPLGLVS